MCSFRNFVFIIAIAVAVVGMPSRVIAHTPHVCSGELSADEPVLPGHLEHADLVNQNVTLNEIIAAGRQLFVSVFNKCDGQGRPATTGTGNEREPIQPAFLRTSAPDSSACAGCHAQPRVGGSGDFVANVFVLAQDLDPVTFSVAAELSNERNTLGMNGAGAIEMLAREMTADLQVISETAISEAREQGEDVTKSLDAKGVNFGNITASADGSVDSDEVEGVDADLIIKPFHQAGAVRSIREFTVNAFNHHHGMQAEERFDLAGKGSDFDQDGTARELTVGDVTAATIFQAALSTPGRRLPADPLERQAIDDGQALFARLACSSCHVPEITLNSRTYSEPNPLNPTGTFSDSSQTLSFDLTQDGETPRLEAVQESRAIMRAYTDLKRHSLCDDAASPDAIRTFCNEQLAQGRPDQNGQSGAEFFLTRKLWDVGSSAPYGHRGDLTTITEAILAHGGEARDSRDAYVALAFQEQANVVKFLKTLQVLPPGSAQLVIEGQEEPGSGAPAPATFSDNLLRIPAVEVRGASGEVRVFEAELELLPSSDPFEFVLRNAEEVN